MTRDNPRAIAVIDACPGGIPAALLVRGRRRLVLQAPPSPTYNEYGEVAGIRVYVRLYDGLTEVPIDPDRIIINPPTVPRANLTYEEGVRAANGAWTPSGRIVAAKDATKGVTYRRTVGASAPAAALAEALWDSVESTPNPAGWRPA